MMEVGHDMTCFVDIYPHYKLFRVLQYTKYY